MLSFMKEEGLKDTLSGPGNEQSNNPAELGGETQAPGNQPAEKEADQEYLTVAAKSSKVRKSTIMLVVMFVAGAACLGLMILKSSPETALAGNSETEDGQIDRAIMRLTGVKSEMFKGIDRIVKKFYEFSDVKQVRVNELAKNPFEQDIFVGGAGKMPDTKGGLSLEEQRKRRERLARQSKKLSLLSIVDSDAGRCCMIDDKILYEADSINGFIVRRIGDDFVELEQTLQGEQPEQTASETIKLVLKLSE